MRWWSDAWRRRRVRWRSDTWRRPGIGRLAAWLVRDHPVGRRVARAFGVCLVALAGVVLGVTLGGSIRADLGPFRAHLAIVPSFAGGTEVQIPPLGSLSLLSHRGPARLSIKLDALDERRARALVTDPEGVERVSESAVSDLNRAVRTLGLRTAGAGLLGGLALTALVYRCRRRTAIGGAVALAALAVTGAVGVATFRPNAIQEPRYEGLLVNAPAVIGDAKRIADQYEEYRAQLQQLVQNVGRLYGTFSKLPVYEPEGGTTRVLHISDLHLNPAAWSIVQTVVKQFDIKVVIDTGDITDWGSDPEASYVQEIAKLSVPYVFIRGNHDSLDTGDAVARQPNATVLSNSVVTVGGLTFAGVGDPRFTPDKSTSATRVVDQEVVEETGRHLATVIATSSRPVDVALVHDPVAAGPLAFGVPVVLSGHIHRREVRRLDGPPGSLTRERTLLMVQGSTGGAGLRGLEKDQPAPLALSVLYFDRSRTLQAYDDIQVGGTGLSEVSLERHVVRPDQQAEASPTGSSPGETSPTNPSPTR